MACHGRVIWGKILTRVCSNRGVWTPIKISGKNLRSITKVPNCPLDPRCTLAFFGLQISQLVTKENECPVNRLDICGFWTLSCQIKPYALFYLLIYSLHNNATVTCELNQQQCPETMSHSWQKLLSGDFYWVENVPFSGGGRELGPHLTKTRLGRGQPPYQVASQSIKPFGHNGHGLKIGGCAPLHVSGSPSNTVGWAEAYLLTAASWFIQLFGHYRQKLKIEN